MIIGKLVGIVVLSYLIGAIPFAMLIGWWIGRLDITKHGSGNIGGTNVMRTVGTKEGMLVIVLDIGKAVAAVVLAKAIMGADVLPVANQVINWQFAQVLAATGAIIGHNWSVFAMMRGGKGVAVYFGGWLAINPYVALAGGIVVIITVLISKYMSLGSILGSLTILILLSILTVLPQFDIAYVYLVYSLIAAVIYHCTAPQQYIPSTERHGKVRL
jgi:glycerol-3-phosphate acyltransferase PlsY